LVGISIDGPEHVHDKYRVGKGGRGSWAKVRDRAAMLLDNGVQVNALTVVNHYSARFAEEIYCFHKELGICHMQFIPCLEPDPDDPARPAAFSLSADGYGKFLCRVYDLWRADFKGNTETTSVRFFDDLFYRYLDMTPPDCALLEECGVYLTVEHNGDAFPCDFFVEEQWRLGNIHHDLMSDMLNSKRQNSFGKIKADLPGDCRKCKWLSCCRGGCPKERGFDPKDKKKNHLCRAYKSFFQHAHKDLAKMADKWLAERADPIKRRGK